MDTFWIAFGSIATAVLAFLTYRSLRQYDKKERQTENRELVEKIIQPILQDIELLVARSLRDLHVSLPRWTATKKENPVLVYRILEKTVAAIEELCADIEKIQLRINNDTLLMGIYTNRVIEKLSNKPATYDASFANNSAYRWRVKNDQSYWFTFPNFLFANSTLAEEIEKSKEGITNAVIEDEIFSAGGREWREVIRSVFDEILANVKNDIAGNAELTEYVQLFRNLYPKTASLKNQLETLKKQLSR